MSEETELRREVGRLQSSLDQCQAEIAVWREGVRRLAAGIAELSATIRANGERPNAVDAQSEPVRDNLKK